MSVATANGIDTTAVDTLAFLHDANRQRVRLTNDQPQVAGSIFSDRIRLFTHYRVSIRFRHKIMGGIPKDPKIIEGWLRSKAGVTDETEIINMTRRTLEQLGLEVPADATIEDMIAASEQIAAVKSTNGFLRDHRGLVLPGRYVKAMLKEATNILWAGDRWGPTKKGPKNYLAERVFCVEDTFPLGRLEPDGVDMVIGHVTGPQGPRSTLGYHEFCEGAECAFTVISLNDCINADQWADLFTLSQELGLGALRSQQHGRFDVTEIVRIARPQKAVFTIRDA